MFLRPRRFGKTAFMNMLCEYYDIAKASSFKQQFGGLYIGKTPTRFQNRYLVLHLDLSLIQADHGLDAVVKSFNGVINERLRTFLHKYKNQLMLEPGNVLQESALGSLDTILVSELSFI
jgi:Predicted AAA-ATPase